MVCVPGSQSTDIAACLRHSAPHCTREHGVKSQLAVRLWVLLPPQIMCPRELASGFSTLCSAGPVPRGKGVREGEVGE